MPEWGVPYAAMSTHQALCAIHMLGVVMQLEAGESGSAASELTGGEVGAPWAYVTSLVRLGVDGAVLAAIFDWMLTLEIQATRILTIS